MGNSQQTAVDAIVYVDPVKYYRMPYYEKAKVARIIGSVNWHYRDSGKKAASDGARANRNFFTGTGCANYILGHQRVLCDF